jgi:DNA-binding transcriptional MerR regulator
VYGIGTVARLAQVSLRTLRYYDELGLLCPVWVDPATGYRWYAPEQLHRLHRILALRDLGVPLAEIAALIDDDLGVDELRGMLLLRRAEAHERMTEERERLARVEARLHQMEDTSMSSYDVIVKRVDPEWVITASEEVHDVRDIGNAQGRLWPRLHAALDGYGIEFKPPSIASEQAGDPIHLTAALLVPEDFHCDDAGVVTMELPGIERVAATVIHGNPNFHEGFQALQTWIREAGEEQVGPLREVYLDCDGPRDTWVVELQLGLRATPLPEREVGG